MRILFSLILLVVTSSFAADFPYEKGKIIGPIGDGVRSGYMFYIPKSMPADRKVPLLFYPNYFDGADIALLAEMAKGAELAGWIIAMTMESDNRKGIDYNALSRNLIEHISDTLPVDTDRVYFTGGTRAFDYATEFDACGIMPILDYDPGFCSKPYCDCFIITGGWSWNRYPAAYMRRALGKKAALRFYDGGYFSAPPAWLLVDGMLWLEGRYLAKKGKREPEELQLFENSMISWLSELKNEEPHRAYYWAWFLQEELSLSPKGRRSIEELVDELGSDDINRLYVEGLSAIDELSLDTLSKFGDRSASNHCDDSVVEACDELLAKYKDVPCIRETLKALRRPTQKSR